MQQSLSSTPAEAEANLRAAVQHHRAGRLGEAEAFYRTVLKQQPGQPVALHLLGVIARQSGHLEAAVDLIGRAVAARPDYAEAHANLGVALRQLERLEEAATAFERALALRPFSAPTLSGLAGVREAQERLPEAIALHRRAVAVAPGNASAQLSLANALQQDGQAEAALEAYGAAHAAAPSLPGLRNNFAAACLKSGRVEQALDLLEENLAEAPQDVRSVAYKTVVLQELGRRDEAARLTDYAELLRRTRLATPEGYGDFAAFSKTLLEELRGHPRLIQTWDPKQRAARGGALIVSLQQDPPPAVAAFERVLRQAIDAFVAQLPEDPSHPFRRRKPRDYTLDIWANLLEPQGHQEAHIHNLGWLSGVFYPQVPETIREEDPEHAGWIEFGRPGYGLPCRFEPDTLLVRPEAGLALLFPSYVWHRTLPFAGPEQRVSIAFDLHARD
ncbi:MAG: putative 2OG-Fe(II) oxygenase [Tistlia sp.]|uniref:putative 2OG-Fe(II) oxygenase n=1 Tax=Tistlia sp. TaxID=3057121 RepID=UPI0034A5A056